MARVSTPLRVLGRYALFDEIAAGGMAAVHFGRLIGPVGFSRTVAIKRLHTHVARDPEFVAMFLDEARLAARIRHPNVVPTLDVVTLGEEIFLVMEYVQGESLARLFRVANAVSELAPIPVVATILVDVLHGLHAAHEAKDEQGTPLGIVHRDVSPHNVLVGIDGVARVLDFGVAKAIGRSQTTRSGQIKGKLAYMAPEQIHGRATRASDIYSTGIMLWELLTGHRLFEGENEISIMQKVLTGKVESPRKHTPNLPPALEEITLRALAREADARFVSARDMALALEAMGSLATKSEVGAWVERLGGQRLAARAEHIADIESSSSSLNVGALAASPPPLIEASDSSSIPTRTEAVSSATAAPSGGSRRGVVVAISALFGAMLLIAGIQLGKRSAPAQAPVAISDVPVSGPAPTPASASALPAVPAPDSPTAPVSASAPPSASSAPRPPRPAAPRPSHVDCNPPYTVDSNGDRHYKRECVQ